MHLSGQLKDWSINDLLQIMQVTQKTGSLDIDGEKQGRVHFRNGALTGAELNGPHSSYVGNNRGGIADVLYVLSSLTEGNFAVGAADGPDTDGWSVEEVIEDVRALQAIESEVSQAGLVEAPGVKVVQEIGSPIEVHPAEWAALASLVQPVSFAKLEANLGRGAAVRILYTLHNLGVTAVVAEGETESAWLDRLADEITPESDAPTWRESEAARAAPPEPSPEAVSQPAPEPAAQPAPPPQPAPDPEPVAVAEDRGTELAGASGTSAPASTMLTDGVYDEIRRLRGKVTES